MAIVRLEGIGHLKNSITSSGLEPAANYAAAYLDFSKRSLKYINY
jgi:hypothetical protein